MPSIALISILCRDKVGLVSAVSDFLFAAGVNLRDTNFAAYGSGAEFTSVCELPPALDVGMLDKGLRRIPELQDAELRVLPYAFEPAPSPQLRITHRVEVAGGDQLGLIARLSEIFAQFGGNIVRLEAQTQTKAQGGRYVTRFAVSLPRDEAEACLEAIARAAAALGLECRIEETVG
jgi:glycine cleavage system transcriptional repressor